MPMKERRVQTKHRGAIALVAAALLLPAATLTLMVGCGGAGGGSGEFAQEFEKPDTPAPEVTLPPDTGDDLSPRDRRAQAE